MNHAQMVIMGVMNDKIFEHLAFLYGDGRARQLAPRLAHIIHSFQTNQPDITPAATKRVSERDAILITYGDMVQAEGERPLTTLANFLAEQLSGLISTIHLLPFFPYSSDDGFSVIDYTAVNPDWGSWDDVAQIGRHFRLMFDAVVNHISVQSDWFQLFLRGERPYANSFITVSPDVDLAGSTQI